MHAPVCFVCVCVSLSDDLCLPPYLASISSLAPPVFFSQDLRGLVGMDSTVSALQRDFAYFLKQDR